MVANASPASLSAAGSKRGATAAAADLSPASAVAPAVAAAHLPTKVAQRLQLRFGDDAADISAAAQPAGIHAGIRGEVEEQRTLQQWVGRPEAPGTAEDREVSPERRRREAFANVRRRETANGVLSAFSLPTSQREKQRPPEHEQQDADAPEAGATKRAEDGASASRGNIMRLSWDSLMCAPVKSGVVFMVVSVL
jgi:hypothetical protein